MQLQPENIERDFSAYRSDPVSRVFMSLGRGHPILLGLVYFLASFAMIYLIGLITGQYAGKNGLPPMPSQIIDNINLAIVAPIGAALLCNLYGAIRKTFLDVIHESILHPAEHDRYRVFLVRLDHLYNTPVVLISAITISVIFNTYNYFFNIESWLSFHGGITGLYGRLWVVVNYYIIAVIIYKIGVTVWGLQQVLSMDIDIQPMHPDRAGGLRPFGRLSVAINSFLAVVIVFVTTLLVFDPFASENPVYVASFILLYISAPFLLILSLSKANRKMLEKKREAMDRLGVTFDYHYQKLSKGKQTEPYDIESADELIRIKSLYGIVESMPVWPFDTESLKRFVTTITLPVIVFLINQVTNTDSVLYQWFRHVIEAL